MTDQFPDRHLYLGASEVSIIMGENPWQTPTELARAKKTGRRWEGNEITEWGHRLEPVVIQAFEERYKLAVYGQQDEFVDPEYGFLRCHIDGVTKLANGECLVEVKTTRRPPWTAVPEYYRMQVMVQMGLSGIHQGVVVGLFQGSEMQVYRVHWDRLEYRRIRNTCVRWWKDHILGEQPVIPKTAEEAKQNAPEGRKGKVSEADGTMLSHIEGYKRCQQHINDMKRLQGAHELQIVLGFGDSEALQGADGDVVATFKKSADYQRFNSAKAKGMLTPDQVEECQSPVKGSRRLVIK